LPDWLKYYTVVTEVNCRVLRTTVYLCIIRAYYGDCKLYSDSFLLHGQYVTVVYNACASQHVT